MRKMLRYELKKIFVKPSGKIALLLLAVLLGVVCWFATDVGFINEQGERETGIQAMRKLRDMDGSRELLIFPTCCAGHSENFGNMIGVS